MGVSQSHRVLLGAVLAAAVALSSCGTSGPGPTTTTAAVRPVNVVLIDDDGGASPPSGEVRDFVVTFQDLLVEGKDEEALMLADRALAGSSVPPPSQQEPTPNQNLTNVASVARYVALVNLGRATAADALKAERGLQGLPRSWGPGNREIFYRAEAIRLTAAGDATEAQQAAEEASDAAPQSRRELIRAERCRVAPTACTPSPSPLPEPAPEPAPRPDPDPDKAPPVPAEPDPPEPDPPKDPVPPKDPDQQNQPPDEQVPPP